MFINVIELYKDAQIQNLVESRQRLESQPVQNKSYYIEKS